MTLHGRRFKSSHFGLCRLMEEKECRLIEETRVQAIGGDRVPYLKTLSAATIRRATVLL